MARVGLEAALLVLLLSFSRGNERMTGEDICKAFQQAMERGVLLIATIGACGIMIGFINYTGIAFRFGAFLMDLTKFSTILTLGLVIFITIFLGTAASGSSAYILTAAICAPSLILMGFEPISVHMFILFFSSLSGITPPVALIASTAATIAETSSLQVSFQAMKLGMIAYLLPVVFMFNPAILVWSSISEVLYSAVIILFAAFLIASGMYGWCRNRLLKWGSRTMLILAGFLSFSGNYILLGMSILMYVVIYVRNSMSTETGLETIRNMTEGRT